MVDRHGNAQGSPPYPLGGELQAGDGRGILWAEHGQELRLQGGTWVCSLLPPTSWQLECPGTTQSMDST